MRLPSTGLDNCSEYAGPAAYLTPDPVYLVAQVEAAADLGLSASRDPRGPGSAHPGYESASSRPYGAVSGRSRSGRIVARRSRPPARVWPPSMYLRCTPGSPLIYLAGAGAVMVAGLVIQAETAGRRGSQRTCRCEQTCDCALPAGITLRDICGRGRPGRMHDWSRPIWSKATSPERLGPD